MRSLPQVVNAIATKGLAGAYRELLPEASKDSVAWIREQGIDVRDARVLEVGCGFGSTASLVQQHGAYVFAFDIEMVRAQHARDAGVPAGLGDANALPLQAGSLDLILSINVLEHLARPRLFLEESYRCLRPGGHLYLAWTNWLSPFGGHDFAPFHYLGPRLGYRVACRLRRKERFIQVPYETMWPIHIGPTLSMIRNIGFLTVRQTPRYFPNLSFVVGIPVVREFLTVNCQLLLAKPR